jgi:hypothetical protein
LEYGKQQSNRGNRMTAIGSIKTKLAEYPTTRYVETPTSIEVQPHKDSGFPVSLHVMDGSFTVYFAGWHEHFNAEAEALNCFEFGLSADCRLCVVYRGSMPTKWIVEARKDGSWIRDSETGLIFVPFWRPRRRIYLQNRLIPTV